MTLTISFGVLGACSRETPARAGKSATPISTARGASASVASPTSPGSIAGDTFLLVTIGSRSTRAPVSDSAPCGFQPYLRLVVSDEHSFYRVTDNRPSCSGPATDSAAHYTGEWSTYRMNLDTLHFFEGDGDERYYWVSGILTRDSLIQLSGDKPFRFVRLRPTVSTRRE